LTQKWILKFITPQNCFQRHKFSAVWKHNHSNITQQSSRDEYLLQARTKNYKYQHYGISGSNITWLHRWIAIFQRDPQCHTLMMKAAVPPKFWQYLATKLHNTTHKWIFTAMRNSNLTQLHILVQLINHYDNTVKQYNDQISSPVNTVEAVYYNHGCYQSAIVIKISWSQNIPFKIN
jgi:hypothetical protein